jgi:hypothetical protein
MLTAPFINFKLSVTMLDMVAKTNKGTQVYENIFKRSNASDMFRPLMWPSSGRCLVAETYRCYYVYTIFS